jgi:hypothetical protein
LRPYTVEPSPLSQRRPSPEPKEAAVLHPAPRGRGAGPSRLATVPGHHRTVTHGHRARPSRLAVELGHHLAVVPGRRLATTWPSRLATVPGHRQAVTNGHHAGPPRRAVELGHRLAVALGHRLAVAPAHRLSTVKLSPSSFREENGIFGFGDNRKGRR